MEGISLEDFKVKEVEYDEERKVNKTARNGHVCNAKEQVEGGEVVEANAGRGIIIEDEDGERKQFIPDSFPITNTNTEEKSMNLAEMARKELKRRGYTDKGWEVVHESVLNCPCGHRIEWDGKCPNGCVSPLRRMGLI